MGLTAPAKGKPIKKISLPLLLDQLDSEWAQQPAPSDLYTYFQEAVRRGLHWIGGDYAHVRFAEEYQTHRLPKLCAWLAGLEDAAPARAA
ncbi:hypothetical protein [Deinococcus irradiatisoli]|uniref:hypothetical protein n=1 Tax=Deinococcus irradiatisoli TaxID=2202254 RepID=UPI0015E854BC|nr:hypothetical protein [Deinococcus irradiatisoli]